MSWEVLNNVGGGGASGGGGGGDGGLADRGTFGVGDGLITEVQEGKYGVTGFDETQEMPDIPSTTGQLTKRDAFGGESSRIIFTATGGGLYIREGTGDPVVWSGWQTFSGLGELIDEEFVKWDASSSQLIGTGITDDGSTIDATGHTLRIESVVTESASVNIGPGLILSDLGGYLCGKSQVDGYAYTYLESSVDANGSSLPLFDNRSAIEVNSVINSDDSEQLAITSFTLPAQTSGYDYSKIYLKFYSEQNNFRFSVVSDETGEIVKYYPSRNDFEKNQGDTIAVGESEITLPSAIGVVPNIPLTFNFFADEPVALLGAGDQPYFAVDRQEIKREQVITAASEPFSRLMYEDSTRVVSGLNIGDDGSTFSVLPGVIDFFDVSDDNDRSTATTVNFAGVFGVTPPVTLPEINYISINSAGTIFARNAPPTDGQRRSEVLVGTVYFDGTNITGSYSAKATQKQVGAQLSDFMQAVGAFKVAGLRISKATDGGLVLANSAGTVFGESLSPLTVVNPHNKSFPEGDPIADMDIMLGDGTIQSAGVNAVDPVNYNPDGGDTYVPVSGDGTKAQIMQIYLLCDAEKFVCLPGQTEYDSLDAAKSGFFDYLPVVPATLRHRTVKICSIIIESGTVDLNFALIVDSIKFGSQSPPASSDLKLPIADQHAVYYDESTSKLVDSGRLSKAAVIDSDVSLSDSMYSATYIVEVSSADVAISLPATPQAGMRFEFVNPKEGSSGWGTGGFSPIISWTDGDDNYFITLEHDDLAASEQYESYTFNYNSTAWSFTYNG